MFLLSLIHVCPCTVCLKKKISVDLLLQKKVTYDQLFMMKAKNARNDVCTTGHRQIRNPCLCAPGTVSTGETHYTSAHLLAAFETKE